MHDAKTRLSRLVEAAANGTPFVIAKAGKPMVRVCSIEAPPVIHDRSFSTLDNCLIQERVTLRLPCRRSTMTLIRRCRTVFNALFMLSACAPLAWSQRGGFRDPYIEPNLPYNGRFTFARIRYTQGYRLAWGVDYPRMERNFMLILDDLSSLALNRAGTNVYTLDDPGLAKHTVAWLTEPGYWLPTEAEAKGLREWLMRGGFLIIDDFFFAQQWGVFERSMRMVLPNVRFFRLDSSHPIFNTFFTIRNLSEMHHPATSAAVAEYYAIYENNDPNGRMLSVISFNNDIGDYMEWSGGGWYPVNLSNNAYKYATNFLVYGLTH